VAGRSEPKLVTYRVWRVPSESQEGVEYTVVFDAVRQRFICDCLGYVVHKTRCKHIDEVINLLKNEVVE
jgi:hypothetical protein